MASDLKLDLARLQMQALMAGGIDSREHQTIVSAIARIAELEQLVARRGAPPVMRLVADVSAGIRVLRERDGVVLTDQQIEERARNIVAALAGNYDIRALDDNTC